MVLDDHRTQEHLRNLLIQEWVDLSRLRYRVQNGVIFLSGHLRTRSAVNGLNGTGDPTALVQRLEREARRLPGYRDIVFALENIHKNGNGWESKDAKGDRS